MWNHPTASQRDRIEFFAWPPGSRMKQPLPSYFLFCSSLPHTLCSNCTKAFVAPNMRSVVSSFCAVALSSAWNFWPIFFFDITTLYTSFNTQPQPLLEAFPEAPDWAKYSLGHDYIIWKSMFKSDSPTKIASSSWKGLCPIFFLPSKQLARCLENSKCFSKSTSYSPPHGD